LKAERTVAQAFLLNYQLQKSKTMLRNYIITLFIFTSTNIIGQTTTFNQSDVKESLVAKTIADAPDSLKVWKHGALFNSNFTNTSLSNWAAGGQNSLTITTLFNAFANYKNGNNQWSNYIELGYGLTKLGKSDMPFRKGDDKIILTSKYGRKLTDNTNLIGLIDFRSQFDKGFKYEIDEITKQENKVFISNIFAPAYIVASIGFEYKPNDKFFFILSPLTSKTTIVNDNMLSNAGAFGVTKGKKSRAEFGSYINTGLKFKVMTNVTYQSSANLFMNYKTTNLIDVFWDNLISLTVNKYITTTFSWVLVYDDDIKIKRENGTVGPALQAKTVLSVGVNVKL
jgi:hypothetical protein